MGIGAVNAFITLTNFELHRRSKLPGDGGWTAAHRWRAPLLVLFSTNGEKGLKGILAGHILPDELRHTDQRGPVGYHGPMFSGSIFLLPGVPTSSKHSPVTSLPGLFFLLIHLSVGMSLLNNKVEKSSWH